MRALRVLALTLALSAVPSTALAQQAPVTVRAEVDRTTMTIGDQILLTVTVDLARGYDLAEPGVPRAVGDFGVVDALTVIQSRGTDGSSRIQLRYLLTTFELGPKAIPPIAVVYRAPDGSRGDARTAGGLVVAVESVIQPGDDTSDIRPLKSPLPVPGANADAIPRALPFIAIGVLVLAAAILALRIRPRTRAVAGTAVLGPARAALEEIERVMELGLPEKGRTREHYDLVAAALRRWVTQRYGLPADARTARELRRDLERSGMAASGAQLLCAVLSDAESVRYEERVIFPARAQKTMRDLVELMRKSVVAEEYELVSSGATA